MYFPLQSDQYRFILCWNAKSACTSLKIWFFETETNIHYDWSIPQNLAGIHTVVGYNDGVREYDYCIGKKITKEDFKKSDYFKFLVVRHPLERLVSMYLHRCRRREKFGIRKPGKGEISFDASFERVCHYILETNPEDLDAHWCVQSGELEDLEFNRIVKVENLDEEMNDVCSQISPELKWGIYHYNSNAEEGDKVSGQIWKQSAFFWRERKYKVNYSDFYSPELREVMTNYFISDMKRFNYL